MDERLWRIADQRVVPLQEADLPLFARMLVGVEQGVVRANTGTVRGAVYVHFEGQGLTLTVSMDDWAKLRPYLLDEALSPSPRLVHVSLWRDLVRPSASIADLQSPDRYRSVLGLLRAIYTT